MINNIRGIAMKEDKDGNLILEKEFEAKTFRCN